MKLSERFINTINEDSIISGENAHAIEDAINFIRKYEDAEEQGRLVILPCKVGDKFYRAIKETCGRPDRINEYVCIGFYYANFDGQGLQIRAYETSDGISHNLKVDVLVSASQFGKNIFLTWQEAKAALKGWQGDG